MRDGRSRILRAFVGTDKHVEPPGRGEALDEPTQREEQAAERRRNGRSVRRTSCAACSAATTR